MNLGITAFLPVLLVICSNLFYHITAKSVPQGINPFASLFITYILAAFIAFACLCVQTRSISLENFKGLNWAAVVLAICIMGLELGNILAYRAGWQISVFSLMGNIILAILLLIVGVLFYQEHITLTKIGGMALCLGGLLLINAK